MRHHFTFPCEGAKLVGTIDEAPGTSGLLIVTGGSEIRAGAWSGQAMLATRLSAAGHPVFRFDRRGIGDSEGVNTGFRGATPDITAAIRAFRQAAPQITRVVAFGNCDAAAALMLMSGEGVDELVLANPWTIQENEEGISTDSVRAHYRQRLRDPAAMRRLVTGRVNLGSLLRSAILALRSRPPATLATELKSGLARFPGQATILLAGRDRTAHTFLVRWDKADPRLHHCPGASHSFVEPEARDWLAERLVEALRR
ncbi:MAG TPA: hydrolase 1, exosortase A system-associated [Novosphingobium sp.]|nr:hydrolase 1, exosortase A system-associated [Novosphingobium sp.]